jgi:hypothetical protein
LTHRVAAGPGNQLELADSNPRVSCNTEERVDDPDLAHGHFLLLLFSPGTSPGHGWGVPKRSVSGAQAVGLWSQARASIADESDCPM